MKVIFNSIEKELSVGMESILTLIKNASLSVPLLASLLIHGAAILAISTVISRNSDLIQKDLIPIGLIEMPRADREIPTRKEEIPPETKKPLPPLRRVEKTKESKPVANNEIVQPQRPAPPGAALTREEPAKPMETKPDVTIKPETTARFSPAAPVESSGSEAGAGKGVVGVVPGSGTAGEDGGTAASGLGRGSGAAGLPAPTTVLKTNREAKPTQTARATYPPMALRMGLEGDVTLRIEVDTEGKVTKAEIIKGAGTVFDEEALKAAKQSRFEPAQKDGRNVPAEFTYVYHFRLTK
jgi:TonB family protein